MLSQFRVSKSFTKPFGSVHCHNMKAVVVDNSLPFVSSVVNRSLHAAHWNWLVKRRRLLIRRSVCGIEGKPFWRRITSAHMHKNDHRQLTIWTRPRVLLSIIQTAWATHFQDGEPEAVLEVRGAACSTFCGGKESEPRRPKYETSQAVSTGPTPTGWKTRVVVPVTPTWVHKRTMKLNLLTFRVHQKL